MTAFARPDEASTGGAAEVSPGEHEERIPALDAATAAALEPRALRAQGCRAVTVGQPVSLGADAEFDIRFVRFLREAMSSLLTVDWSLAAPYPGDVSDISHLPPPAARKLLMLARPRVRRGAGASSTASGTATTGWDRSSCTS
jgi:hypothetical protein